jgi:putative permease
MLRLIRDWLNRYFSDPQSLILGLLLLAGFLIVMFLGEMLTPVFVSLVIAYLLDGMAIALQRIKVPRLVSVLLVFLLFLATLFILVVGLLPLLSRQIGQLLQELPAIVANGRDLLMRLPERYPEFITQTQIRQVLDFIGGELYVMIQRLLTLSVASVRGLISILIYTIMVPVMVFFFLIDKAKLLDWVSQFLPDHRGLAVEVWGVVDQQITNYVRGKIWEIVIVWGVTYATFYFMGLRFAMLLSLFTGLSVLIPYIGAIFMTLPVAVIAFYQWGWGADFAYALLAYLIIQILDGNLLVPLLLAGVVNLHPVAVISAILVFGGLWGFWGLFFAIPLATLVHAVIKAWFAQHRRVHAQ